MEQLLRKDTRVRARDRIWTVGRVSTLGGSVQLVELHACDDCEPRSLSVIRPPERIDALETVELIPEARAFDSLRAWQLSHRILATTAVRETGLLSGARFGRVAIEAYQAAPALRILAKPRPSLLVADDVGLGKTIEAGLVMLELMARRRAERVLIVAPAGLLHQWRDELDERFGLQFELIENASGLARVQSDLPAGASPWDSLPRVLTSVDFLKKESVRLRALRKRWDLVVVDEAHCLAESGTAQSSHTTQRSRLGRALRDAARALVLLTATPHNGQAHSFRSLLELVEPTQACLSGQTDDIRRRVERSMVRRMKAQIRRRAATGVEEVVFPPRTVTGVRVDRMGGYHAVLDEVASYCSRTARQAGGTDDEELVGFAMQIVKKRALSSRAALERTIANRLEALKKDDAREEPPARDELRELAQDLPLSEAQAERTALKLLRSAIPSDGARRKTEIKALSSVQKRLEKLPPGDPKLQAVLGQLASSLLEQPGEKAIVFTEYRDTLESLRALLDAHPEFAGRYVVLQGGLTPRQRTQRQADFESPDIRVLLATDAASEGLNLQRYCRRVVHCELPWNPNRLEQRNGRVDRYGQRAEPQIHYFYYAESPEEGVLHSLVSRLETMIRDRVSTPDVLGVLALTGELGEKLTALDPSSADVAAKQLELVRHFEDQSREFVRSVQPLLDASRWTDEERERLLGMLDSASPLVADDAELEDVALGLLGAANVREVDEPGLFRIQVPLQFRGPGVQAVYARATFRRSMATRLRTRDVEYLTPIHPLVRALSDDAARRLLQVYAGERGLAPRRLAARWSADGEPTSVVFTFLANVRGGGELLEEEIVAVRIGEGARVLPDVDPDALWKATPAGGPTFDVIQNSVNANFTELSRAAHAEALRRVVARAHALRERRREQAALLNAELERDLADRLAEIDEDERRARGLVEGNQVLLFGERDARRGGHQTRRDAARHLAEERRRELAEFARIDEPAQPHALGALFLLEQGRAS